MFCIPRNLVKDKGEKNEEHHAAAGVKDTDDEKVGEPVMLKFCVRLSTGHDFQIEMPGHVSVMKLKEELSSRAQVPVENQRVILRGKMLRDNEPLFQNIKNESLVQVMVRT